MSYVFCLRKINGFRSERLGCCEVGFVAVSWQLGVAICGSRLEPGLFWEGGAIAHSHIPIARRWLIALLHPACSAKLLEISLADAIALSP